MKILPKENQHTEKKAKDKRLWIHNEALFYLYNTVTREEHKFPNPGIRTIVRTFIFMYHTYNSA